MNKVEQMKEVREGKVLQKQLEQIAKDIATLDKNMKIVAKNAEADFKAYNEIAEIVRDQKVEIATVQDMTNFNLNLTLSSIAIFSVTTITQFVLLARKKA